MTRVLVVGQTPPPFGGQAVMIEKLLRGDSRRVRFYHVRMAFSREMDDIGRFQLRKILHLFAVVLRIYWCRFRHGTRVLYYPPAAAGRVPMYRDVAVLGSTRWLFRRCIFHFHNGGITQLLPRLFWPERLLFRLAYARPDCAIRLSDLSPPDGALLNARHDVAIPNGAEDAYPQYAAAAAAAGRRPHNPAPRILYVGLITQGKGIRELLEACRLLAARGVGFRLDLLGRFASSEFEGEVKAFLACHGLGSHVALLGVRTGAGKWATYAAADVFCFPSYIDNFPVAVIEAMQFELPVVATHWRGIPRIVQDGRTGYLVPVRDVAALADRLALLLEDPGLRRRLGEAGRDVFLSQFTIGRWHAAMERAILAACTADAADLDDRRPTNPAPGRDRPEEEGAS